MADRKPTPKAPARRSRSRRRRGPGHVIGTIAKVLGLTVCLAIIAGAAVVLVAYQRTSIPDPNSEFATNTTYVTYRDGTTNIGSFAVQNRQSLPYEEMPGTIKDAAVSAENRDFWTDKGFSITGMARSVWAILNGGELQGGSTITQQYVKVYYLTQERTAARKFTELLLAVKLSRETSKEEILEGYLNTIYFGRGAYGIQAASRAYFNKDAAELSYPEAAVLASVLNNPSIYDPSEGEGNAGRLLDRYRYVMDGLVEMGRLDPATAAQDKQALPDFPEVPSTSRFGGTKGYLLTMVKDELLRNGFTEAEINGGGLQVTTTFDQKSQAAAVTAAQKYRKQVNANKSSGKKEANVGLASIDNDTGEIRALYGGADYVTSQRNWATTRRPTGSTFKAYALAAGLQDGFSLRTTLRGNTFTPPGDGVSIRNEFRHQYGTITLRRATAVSANTAFVDMTTQMDDGPQKIIKAANDAGVPTNDNDPGWFPGSRISLGTAEVSPVGMAAGYSTYANGGEQIDAHVVREVRDAEGKVVYSSDAARKRTVDADVVRDVTFALSDVVDNGSGARVSTLGRPVAGKTGTASGGQNEEKVVSAWFVGYTPQVTTAVMYVAGESGSDDLDPYKRPGDGTFFGGTYPALTWGDYMKVAMEGMAVEQFPEPAYVHRDRASEAPPATNVPRATNRPARPSSPRSSQPPRSSPSNPPSRSPSSAPPSSQAPTSQEPSSPPPSRSEQPTSPPTSSAPAPTRSQRPTGGQSSGNSGGSGGTGGGSGGNGNSGGNGGGSGNESGRGGGNGSNDG